MKIKYEIKYSVELNDCKIDYLVEVFKYLVLSFLEEFIKGALVCFGEELMKKKRKSFICTRCGNRGEFIRKSHNAKMTKVMTIFGEVRLPQLQVQCKGCGKKMFITRFILGLERYALMSVITARIIGLVGSLCSFRVSEKISELFGVKFSRMLVWRCVRHVGSKINFDVDAQERNIGEADGTGIPIKGIKKRGLELKVFVQRKFSGGVRVAGVTIGKYDSEWEKLFAPLVESLKSFKRFLLITDGDTNIFKGLRGVTVMLQRCLWHIPHQLKHSLWTDGIKRKSDLYWEIMGRIFGIVSLRPFLEESEIAALLKEKKKDLDKLIDFCEAHGCSSTVSYLKNAKANMFTSLEKRLNGKTTSFVERVMRTVNMRINVGKWTREGALNAVKIRLAHYYNDWIPDPRKIKHDTVAFKYNSKFRAA